MGALSPTHWLIVLAVLVLLFGAKKLPEMARSVGRSSRILKSEMRVLRDDDDRPAGIEADAARTGDATAGATAPPAGEHRG